MPRDARAASCQVCRTPWIRTLERIVEIEHVLEILSRIAGLAHQQAGLDERKDNIPDMSRRAYAPVVEDEPRQDTEALQCQFAYRMREFTSVDMTPLREA